MASIKLDDQKSKWIDIVMQEYNSLRKEVEVALHNQQSIINYGLAAIGFLFAFAANSWEKSSIIELTFAFFIPFVCHIMVIAWNGEIRRMSRAGKYIKELEDKVHIFFSKNTAIQERPLNWETHLRSQNNSTNANELQKKRKPPFSFVKSNQDNKMKSNYYAIILMFWIMSTLSIILAFFHNYDRTSRSLHDIHPPFIEWLSHSNILLIIYMILFLTNSYLFKIWYNYFIYYKK